MDWIRDGQTITGEYLGHRVTGKVLSSRVKYGGRVQYTVQLDTPVQFAWRSEPTDRVLIDAEEIVENIA